MKKLIVVVLLLIAGVASAVVIVQRGRGFVRVAVVTPTDPGNPTMGWDFNIRSFSHSPTNFQPDLSGNDNYAKSYGGAAVRDYWFWFEDGPLDDLYGSVYFMTYGWCEYAWAVGHPGGLTDPGLNMNTNSSAGVWVKIPSTLAASDNNYQFMLCKGTWGNGWGFRIDGSAGASYTNLIAAFFDGDDERVTIPNANLNDDQWHLLGMDFDDDNNALYVSIDGEYVGSNMTVDGVTSNDHQFMMNGYDTWEGQGMYYSEAFFIRGSIVGEAGWSNYYNNGVFPTNDGLRLRWAFTNTINSWRAVPTGTNCPSLIGRFGSVSEPSWAETNGQGYLTFDGVNDAIWLTYWRPYGRTQQGQPNNLGDTNTCTISWWRRDSDPDNHPRFSDWSTELTFDNVDIWDVKVGGSATDTGPRPAKAFSIHARPAAGSEYYAASNAYTTASDANVWRHFCVTFDKQASPAVTVYKDGVALVPYTNNITQNPFLRGTDGAPGYLLYVGCNWARSWHTRGDLDEFVLFPDALTPEQVLGLYQQGRDESGWNDPVAAITHIPFQNNAGYITDESLAGNDGTLIGLAYDCTERAYQNAGSGNSYIDGGTNSVFRSTNVAMACWVKWTNLEGPANVQGIMTCVDSADQNGYLLMYYELVDRVRGYVDRNGAGDWVYAEANADVVTNEWQHWAMTLRGTTLELYKNGVLQDATTCTNSTLGTNNTLVIAKYGLSTSYPLHGLVDNIRYYDAGLTSNQISTIAAANRTNETIDVVSTNDLALYYSCENDDNMRDYGSGRTSMFYPDGTPDIGPTWVQDGVNRQRGSRNRGRGEYSYYLDGAGDRMVMQYPPSAYSGQTNGFTASLWVTNDNKTGTAGIMVKYKWEYPTGYSYKRDWLVLHSGANLIFVVFQQDNNNVYIGKNIVGGAITASQGWVNLTVRYDGGTSWTGCDIFTNGVEVTTGIAHTAGTFTNASYNSDYAIFLGSYVVLPGPYNYYWRGHFDDYKFWTTALTDAQILENAQETGTKGTPIPDHRDENNY
jgi:hypothetical protein